MGIASSMVQRPADQASNASAYFSSRGNKPYIPPAQDMHSIMGVDDLHTLFQSTPAGRYEMPSTYGTNDDAGMSQRSGHGARHPDSSTRNSTSSRHKMRRHEERWFGIECQALSPLSPWEWKVSMPLLSLKVYIWWHLEFLRFYIFGVTGIGLKRWRCGPFRSSIRGRVVVESHSFRNEFSCDVVKPPLTTGKFRIVIISISPQSIVFHVVRRHKYTRVAPQEVTP